MPISNQQQMYTDSESSDNEEDEPYMKNQQKTSSQPQGAYSKPFSIKKIKPSLTIRYNKLSSNSETVIPKEISCAGKATTKLGHCRNISENEDRA